MVLMMIILKIWSPIQWTKVSLIGLAQIPMVAMLAITVLKLHLH